MQKTKLLLLISILIFAILSCNAFQTSQNPGEAPTQEIEATTSSNLPSTEAEVPRVTLEDAKAALDNGEAVVVDVRSRQAFEISHIPGALNIPLGEIETNPSGLSLAKDQWIITYCT
ncbi:MAG: hypothetical protein C3F07_04255 [Anaerolineales bacterium]|nr:rhodanese-like domain-containing protein [Anaerolineae bacterium]PWB76037.1 MAG: hypothetical protein C3F07_04255 [Anaerolineales bacterium]